MGTSIRDSRIQCRQNNCRTHTCTPEHRKSGLDAQFVPAHVVGSHRCRTALVVGIPSAAVVPAHDLTPESVGVRRSSCVRIQGHRVSRSAAGSPAAAVEMGLVRIQTLLLFVFYERFRRLLLCYRRTVNYPLRMG